jgi:hypothetical protein
LPLQQPGGAEQHGDVRVVAARVHLPGDLALVLPFHRFLIIITTTTTTVTITAIKHQASSIIKQDSIYQASSIIAATTTECHTIGINAIKHQPPDRRGSGT